MKGNKLKELERQAGIRERALQSAFMLYAAMIAAALLITLAVAFA